LAYQPGRKTVAPAGKPAIVRGQKADQQKSLAMPSPEQLGVLPTKRQPALAMPTPEQLGLQKK
jgi:hypothetical protein